MEESLLIGKVNSKLAENIKEKVDKITKKNIEALKLFLLSSVKVLSYKVNTEDNKILMPVDISSSNESKYFVINSTLQGSDTFKKVLVNMKKEIEVCEELNDNTSIVICTGSEVQRALFEEKCINNSISLGMYFNNETLEYSIYYNTINYNSNSVNSIIEMYSNILNSIVNDINIEVRNITLVDNDFIDNIKNSVNKHDIDNSSIKEIIEESLSKNANNILLTTSINLKDVYDYFEGKSTVCNEDIIKNCIFIERKLIFEKYMEKDNKEGYFYKSIYHNTAIVNKGCNYIISLLSEEHNLQSIYNAIKDDNIQIYIKAVEPDGDLEIYQNVTEAKEYNFTIHSFNDLCQLTKILYKNNIIEVLSYNEESKNIILKEKFKESKRANLDYSDIIEKRKDLKPCDIALIGDTKGMATIGLLYISSYLNRHNITSYVRVEDFNNTIQDNDKEIMEIIQGCKPKFVGLSMKWFPHIARVYHIAEMIKEYDNNIKIIVGGNTASYYADDVIENEFVDYVVRGDGEEPMKGIILGEDNVPNVLYKKDNKVIKDEFSYVQKIEDSKNIYLQDIKDSALSVDSLILGTFYINTHKGCAMNCLYCGGCRSSQKDTFNRVGYFRRDPVEVRKDIMEVKDYTSTLMFDFDIPNDDLVAYCKEIWDGIDLSNHFCSFTNLIPPTKELVDYVTSKFKYVYWTLDMCSLSEAHRFKLFEKGLCKPQPKDSAIYECLDLCDNYDNNEVRINIIAGLPYFGEEDIKISEKVIDKLTYRYKCLSGLHWGRLHAQPGAPVSLNAEEYDMISYASSYEEFLYFSELNLRNEEKYPELENYNYPYIYFNDDKLNSAISKHYTMVEKKLNKYLIDKKKKQYVYKRYTYKEVDELSNSLANYLIDKGIKLNDKVIISCENSVYLAASIIAVIKCGGVYIPVDINYPKDRINYMINTVSAKFVLCTSEIDLDINKDNLINVNNKEIYSYDKSKVSIKKSLNDPAYMIFTSGTTGKPKGIVISDSSICNFIKWRIHEYKFTSNDVVLQTLSYSFDGFYTNFYSAIASGAELVLLSDIQSKNYYDLPSIIRMFSVTNFSTVPQIAKAIMDYSKDYQLSTVRSIVLAGQKADEYVVSSIINKIPNIELINEYGPTECTIATIFNKNMTVDKIDVIGRPIWNTGLVIINKEGLLVNKETVGEICITGKALSLGYYNQEELTKKSFVKLRELDGIYYKTGDYGKLLNDGDIRIAGRIDEQLKIRGYRIESHEIEKNILNIKGITSAEVTVLKQDNDVEKLAAYYETSNEVNVTEIKDYLSSKLPKYMVPSEFIEVSEMPKTLNGKIDMKKLQSMKQEDKVKEEITVPRTDEERHIAKIWSEVLNTDEIGIDTNFFDLGGNSFNVLTVVSKCENMFTMEDVFEYPTIRLLSDNVINKNREKGILRKLYDSEEAEYDLVCIPYAGGNTTVYNSLVNCIKEKTNKINIYAVNLPGHDIFSDDDELKSIESIAKETSEYIKDNIKHKVLIYSHCGNGAALALELSRLLVENGTTIVKLFIGAALPQSTSKTKLSIIKKTSQLISNKALYSRLSNLGFDVKVEEKYVDKIINIFRFDGESATDYYLNNMNLIQNWNKFKFEIINIAGSEDPATKGYKTKYKEWLKFAEDAHLEVIEGAGHYFLNTNCNEVCNIICNKVIK